jgi:hypothetical protein
MTETTQPTMSAPTASAHLANALGGSAGAWLSFLANDRKPSRVKRQLLVEPGPGRPRYAKTTVDAYIESVRAKGMQEGSNDAVSGSSKGRRLIAHISALTVDDGVDEPVVLFVTASPLMAFYLAAGEARQLARRLIRAADDIEEEVPHQNS